MSRRDFASFETGTEPATAASPWGPLAAMFRRRIERLDVPLSGGRSGGLGASRRLPRNDQRITSPGALEILAPHGEDFAVAVEWVPDADRIGCGAVGSRHRDRVGIFEENEDRIAEAAFRQPVPIEPCAFGSNSKIADQFDEAGG